MRTLLLAGDPVDMVSHGWDKYGGRINGSIAFADGRDYAGEMIQAGHAKPRSGEGPKPT